MKYVGYSSSRRSILLTPAHPIPRLPPALCSFLCENYYRRLQLEPEDVLGRPLASIVDPLDVNALRNAVFGVISKEGIGSTAEQGRGTLIHLRVACGGFVCQASMTLVIGTQGLIVVTRLYDA